MIDYNDTHQITTFNYTDTEHLIMFLGWIKGHYVKKMSTSQDSQQQLSIFLLKKTCYRVGSGTL